jgi:peptidoglycan/xylan/chitin deacetylase (PgdA/CDA1 family)
MRSKIAALCLLASFIGIGTAGAEECPAGALGVSRTLVVDPTEHVRLGSWQYPESLPLKDREVVLTFDDGPLPAYTNRILDLLAAECVKATFFMVGRMVQAYPAVVRRIYSEGHTVANHSMTHPFTFHKMSVDQASHEIEGAFAALRTALGDPKAVVAPFFRFPGLLRQTSVEQYLAAHNYMAWSIDLAADDWTHINNQEVARRAISRLEARGKGILLLHDIQPATALAMPEILRELKARGFKIVHVVPATAERPKTVTQPELWAVRRTPSPEEKIWPRTLVMGESPEPVLAAPSPASFGIESFGSGIKVAMVQTIERKVMSDGDPPLPPMTVWPRPAIYQVPADAQVLPIPAAHNFRYSRPFRLGPPEKQKTAAVASKAATAAKPRRAAQPAAGWFFGQQPAASHKAYGHQLSVTRSPTNLSAPQFR